MSLTQARRVADAVLYEGLVLYPYRATSRKNRFRFQFGVLAPWAFASAGGSEPSSMTLEVPVEGGDQLAVRGILRGLQLRRRSVQRWDGAQFHDTDALQVEDQLLLAWDEAVEREFEFPLPGSGTLRLSFECEAARSEELVRDPRGELQGRVLRRTEAIRLELNVGNRPSSGALRVLRVQVDNLTPHADDTLERERALRKSLVGAHLLLSAEDGAFVSLLDPPEHARAAAARCQNERLFPVLVGRVGERGTLLGSPIILYDWPAIAPESPGNFFDATEMDEMLALRTLTLTEQEKREARATDPRAAELIERTEQLSADALQRLHGAVRSLRVGRVDVKKGSRVRIRLGRRRGDAQDMFSDGRVATVEDVREDVDGNAWVAVLLEGDPARDLQRWFGRLLWFHDDEIEPLEATS